MDANELLKLVFVLADTTATDATDARQVQRNAGTQMYFEGRADIMDCLIKAAGYRKEFEEWRNKPCRKA